MTLRNRKNKYPNNYDIGVLRNKFHFSFIGEKLGLPVIKNSYIIDNGLISRLGSEEDTLLEFGSFLTSLSDFSFFIKTLSGECGDGVFSVSKTKGVYFLNTEKVIEEKVIKSFLKGTFIVQEKIEQHDALNQLYSGLINTIRVTTVKIAFCSPSVLRIGAHGNNVDNWARGGIIVPITLEGKLSEFGFYKPGYSGKTNIHPDTLIQFKDFQLPFYDKAIQIVIDFHKYIDVHSIGWDIALTEGGPVVIEGNDNWEVTLPQITGGFKGFIKKYFDK